MERTTTWTASQATARTSRAHLTRRISTGALAAALALVSQASLADEGGVSFWIPGFFGSLAATPQQPGWSLVNMYYHTTVSAGADVSRAREITIGKIPANLSANLSANLNATGGSWHCHSVLCVRNAGPGWPVGRRCNCIIWPCKHLPGGDLDGRADAAGVRQHPVRPAIRQHQRLGVGLWRSAPASFAALEQRRSQRT